MSQNCSLYCLDNNPEKVLDSVRTLVKHHQLEIEGDETDWKAFRYQSSKVTMIINRLQGTSAGDSFSELVENTYSFVNSIESSNQGNKTELLQHINASIQILAVEVDTEETDCFDEDCEDILFTIAENLNGVLFTGNEFLNIKGGLVLDVEGHSDEGVSTDD